MYRQNNQQTNNKHSNKSIAFPDYMTLLERIQQQKGEQNSIRVVFVCNEEHCIAKQRSMSFPLDESVETVYAKIMDELNSLDQLPSHSGDGCKGCASDGGHLVEHAMAAHQRLILCNQDWEFEKVIVADFDSVDQPLVEGTGDDLTVVGGDDPLKHPLSSFFHCDELFLMKFWRQPTLYFIVDTRYDVESPFYQISADESQTSNGNKTEGQLRTLNVYTVELGLQQVKFVKLIGLPERATIGELKMVLTRTILRVAEAEEISTKKAAMETKQKDETRKEGEGTPIEMNSGQRQKEEKETEKENNGQESGEKGDKRKQNGQKSGAKKEEKRKEAQFGEDDDGTPKRCRLNEDNGSSSSSSSTHPLGEGEQELLQQLHCRVVFDNASCDNGIPNLCVYAERNNTTNLKCLNETGISQFGTLTVFVDVGPAECLLADRAISDFDSTLMKQLILAYKSAQIANERPAESKSLEQYLNFGVDQSAIELGPEKSKQWHKLRGHDEDPPTDISSCQGTPQISPIVSADEDDGLD